MRLLNTRLPWWPWLHLCAWNAESIADGIGRRSRSGLRFVQIGANDGVLNDPIHASVQRYGWHGLLVEPIPWIFDRLVANYSGAEGMSFENAAISATDGTMPMFYVERRDGDPDFLDQLFSFDEEILRSHRYASEDFDERVVRTEVNALTMPSLVARHGIETIDVLHIDTEGYDVEILKQVDFSAQWAPRFILFEIKHLDPGTYRQARSMLRAAGYRVFPVWHDAFAYRDHPRR